MDFRFPVVLFPKPVNNRGGIGVSFWISSHRFLSSHPRINFGVGAKFFDRSQKNTRMFHIFFNIILDHPGIQLFEKKSVEFFSRTNFSQKRKIDFSIFKPPVFS
jgi:hypothetical protein